MINKIWNEDYYNMYNTGPYIWHDVGPKRWNVIVHLIEMLKNRYGAIRMLEVGVDT